MIRSEKKDGVINSHSEGNLLLQCKTQVSGIRKILTRFLQKDNWIYLCYQSNITCNHAAMHSCFATVKTIKINRKQIALTGKTDALNL